MALLQLADSLFFQMAFLGILLLGLFLLGRILLGLEDVLGTVGEMKESGGRKG